MKRGMDMSKERLGLFLSFMGGLLWGIGSILGQFLFEYKNVTAIWLVPWRLLFAGTLILLFYFLKSRTKIFDIWKERRNRRDILIYGILGIMLCQYSYFQTIEWSNAATATFIQYIGPTLIIVYACVRGKRYPKWQEVAAVVFATSGIYLLATHGNPGNLVISPGALIMGLTTAVTVVIYTVFAENLQKQFPTLLILGWAMFLGSLVLMLLFRPWTIHDVIIDWQTVAVFSSIVLFTTITSFGCYMTGVSLCGGVKAGLMACVEPVISAILTAALFHVSFTPMDYLGFVLIIGTLLVTQIP